MNRFSMWGRVSGIMAFLLLLLFAGLGGCALPEGVTEDFGGPPAGEQIEQEQKQEQAGDPFEMVAKYIREHGRLPDQFITKAEARKLGWEAQAGNLHDVAPGKSIGGDRFYNREGRLPDKPGRIWYEADIGYEGGHRGSERIVYSNDGLIYRTSDHYETFERIEVD